MMKTDKTRGLLPDGPDGNEPVLVAVSGGLDSMCLLHWAVAWGQRRGVRVTAAHFNHQLRGAASDQDEAFVRDCCLRWNIPLVCGRGDVRALAERKKLTLEEAARELRYDFLRQTAEDTGSSCIMTAHHADDNAETMLLNLLRGTGLRGLTGIPERRDAIQRPFLSVTRAELAEYAAVHQIPHVEDETNRDPELAARNLIRLQIMPLLKKLNPRAVENMSRTAELLKQDEQALEQEVEQLLTAGSRRSGQRAELETAVCQGKPDAVVNRMIWRLMADVCGRKKDLTAAHVASVTGLLASGMEGKECSLPYGMYARRRGTRLFLEIRDAAPEECALVLEETVCFGNWRVKISAQETPQAMALDAACLNEALRVTAWRSGDALLLPEANGSRSIKRLCAERGILPCERDARPVLRVGERPIAMPGVGLDVNFAPQEHGNKVFITFYLKVERENDEK